MHYQYQPKHTKETDVARVPLASRSLKSGVAAAAVTAALLPALLATPALAATQIGIDGSTYTEAASGTGSNGGSWSWGGNDSDPLNLNGSNGGAISWQGGDLTINATGDNTVGAGTDSGQGCSVSDNVTAVDNEKDGTTAYTDADGKAASPSDLTITGGGTVSVESAVRVSGGLTVTGGSTLSYVGEDRLGEEGWDEYVAADGGITVEGGSTITTDSDSAYSLFTSGTDISVTGGSKLENVDISTAGGLYVSGSSVDTPWNIVVAVATIDSSDVRCTGELEAVEKGIRLAGSVVRSASHPRRGLQRAQGHFGRGRRQDLHRLPRPHGRLQDRALRPGPCAASPLHGRRVRRPQGNRLREARGRHVRRPARLRGRGRRGERVHREALPIHRGGLRGDGRRRGDALRNHDDRVREARHGIQTRRND